MKIGVNLSMIFTEVPLIERFSLAKQAGFDYVEIQFPYELSIQSIAYQLQKHQLQLCLINISADDLLAGGDGLACIPHRQADYRKALDLALDYAIALNIPKINVLAGRVSSQYSRQQAFACFIDNLNFTVERCQNTPIQVVFEMINPDDMPNFLIQNLQDVNQVLELVPKAYFQFDCYHIAKIQEPVLEHLKHYINSNQIGHIQFADYPNRHEPFTGKLDFMAIFNYLKHIKYQGEICAEYKPSQHSCHSFLWKEHL